MSKQKSYVITEAADAMAAELAEANGLGKSALLEVLIRQAHNLNWSVAQYAAPATWRITGGDMGEAATVCARQYPAAMGEISLSTIIGPKEARIAVSYDIWTSSFAAWHKRGLPRPYTLGDILAMHERLHPARESARQGAVERVRQYINATKKERMSIDDAFFEMRKRG